MKLCTNCGKEIINRQRIARAKYCITCAPIVAKEYIRLYQKARDEANKAKRLARYDHTYQEINKLPPVILAYVGGLFDGEGCATIVKVKPNKITSAPEYTLHASITNNYSKVLYFVKDNFGIGNVVRDRNGYKWASTNRSAAIFLTCVEPYLKIKHDQALVGIQLQSLINREYHGSLNRLSQIQIEEREELRQEILRLNSLYRAKRGIGEVSGIYLPRHQISEYL